MKQRVLLIEDEVSIADTLAYALESEGFAVLRASTIAEGRRVLFGSETLAAVVLDVGLPDGTGTELCKEIRSHLSPAVSALPVLFLTARAGEIDRVVGLEIGADDYVTKPFSPREVSSRVKAILRRIDRPAPSVLQQSIPGAFAIDEDRLVIRFHGAALELSPNEFRLLKVLVERPGKVFSREQLLGAAWEDPLASLERTVDAHIKSIRAKLHAVRADADPIVTHRGFGYSLRPDDDDSK